MTAFSLGCSVEQRQDLRLVTENDEAGIGPPFKRQRSAGDDNGRAVIPAHRIESDCNRSFHGVMVDPGCGGASAQGGVKRSGQ